MAKQYRQRESGLLVPDWFPARSRRRPTTRRNFIFTPGGGPCNCGGTCCFNPWGTQQYCFCQGSTPLAWKLTLANFSGTSHGVDYNELNGDYEVSFIGTVEHKEYEYAIRCEWLFPFDSPFVLWYKDGSSYAAIGVGVELLMTVGDINARIYGGLWDGNYVPTHYGWSYMATKPRAYIVYDMDEDLPIDCTAIENLDLTVEGDTTWDFTLGTIKLSYLAPE